MGTKISRLESEVIKTPLEWRFLAWLEVLERLLSSPQSAEMTLNQYFRERSGFGPQERADLADGVYGLLRKWYWLLQWAPITAPRRLILAYWSRTLGMASRELLPLMNAEEQLWMQHIKAQPLSQELSIQSDLPDFVIQSLRARYQDSEILELGRSLQQPGTLDLRVNTWRMSRAEALSQLQLEYSAESTPFSPFGIRMKGKPALYQHPLMKNGIIEVQDEGSQLLGMLVEPKRREMVADLCAGAGGKTLHFGALMNNQGRVYAFDISKKRLEALKPRLKRSGLSNIHPVLLNHERSDRLSRLAGKMDRVLVDAPCSGLGTLRRNPELKWRHNAETVAELVLKQQSILQAAARLVKPGGRLVYATCSLLVQENEAQAAWFNQNFPDFVVVNVSDCLSQINWSKADDPYLRLSPLSHHTDGFFAAVWQRLPHA